VPEREKLLIYVLTMIDTIIPYKSLFPTIGVGFLLNIGSLIFRNKRLSNRNFGFKGPFWCCLWLSILGHCFVFCGFLFLIITGQDSAGNNNSHSNLLTVLSLLSAGAFAGFCAVEYDKARKDEYLILNFISGLFVSSLYLLFSAICFYLGKNHKIEELWIVPVIMLLLLVLFTVIDIWDYRAPQNSSPHPPSLYIKLYNRHGPKRGNKSS